MSAYKGKVVAIICAGTDVDRSLAVALAEAGADLAIATLEPIQQQEFATASIANEVWAIGREQFSQVLDTRDADAVARFAQKVVGRLGRCDELVVSLPARGLGAGIAEAFATGLGGEVAVRVLDASGAGAATPAGRPRTSRAGPRHNHLE